MKRRPRKQAAERAVFISYFDKTFEQSSQYLRDSQHVRVRLEGDEGVRVFAWKDVEGSMETWEELRSRVATWDELKDSLGELGVTVHAEPPSEKKMARMERCLSVVDLMKNLLPADQRRDFADEWLDEIESAAEGGRPIVRRTASIILRALPVSVVRSRLPAQRRKGRSNG